MHASSMIAGCEGTRSAIASLALATIFFLAQSPASVAGVDPSALADSSALVAEYRGDQARWIGILPPTTTQFLMDGGVHAFVPTGFKPDPWFKKVTVTASKGYRTYAFTLGEDKATRSIIVRNAKGTQIGSIPPPPDYDPTWLARLVHPDLYGGKHTAKQIADILARCDPSRVVASFTLVPEQEMAAYLADRTQVARDPAVPSGGMGMLMEAMSYTQFGDQGNSNHLGMHIWNLDATSIVVDVEAATTFTNHVAIVNAPALVPTNWNVVASNLVQSDGLISWTNRNVQAPNIGFYACYDSDLRELTDGDNDGLTAGAELFLAGSSPTNSDTDGDGFPDGVEFACNTAANNSNSVPVVVTFSPATVVVLTNRTYSAGYFAHLEPMAACTTAVPASLVGRMAATSTCSTVAQATGRYESGSNICYSIQTGTNGTAWIRAALGSIAYASQTVHSAGATWNESLVRMAVAPLDKVHWCGVSPTYSELAETNDVGVNVNPAVARSYFTMPPSNSNPSVCQFSGTCGGTGIQVTAYAPGTADISVLLDGIPGASFGVDVAEVYFSSNAMTILTNETTDLWISVTPGGRCTNVWTTNHNPTIVEVQRPGASSWKVKGLAVGTAYVDTGYGKPPRDRIKIQVIGLDPDSTNLVMALDSTCLTNTYDWCRVEVGITDQILDWSWLEHLDGSSGPNGWLLPTEPPGKVVAELLTNGIPGPDLKLMVTPAADAGGSATVILREKPPGTNVYAQVTANVVKARPFTNMLYVAENGSGKLTLTEANVLRGGWTSDNWLWEYPGPNNDVVLQGWEDFVGDVEYRWVIEKQWCHNRWGEQDVNARYNPTCMVYFCSFAFTNATMMTTNRNPLPFMPISCLPTNAPADLADSVFTLRYVGGTGVVGIDVDSDRHVFCGYEYGSNAVTMTDHLDETIEPDVWPKGAKVWTLPGEIRGFVEGEVDLEYLITNRYGVVASNVISLFVVAAHLNVDGVAETDKTTIGKCMWWNADDDNGNGIPDKDEAPTGGITNENNLVSLTLSIVPPVSNGTARLTISQGADKVKLWQDQRKQDSLVPQGVPPSLTWSPTSMPTNLFIEGISGSMNMRDVVLQLSYESPGGSALCTDKAKVTIVPLIILQTNKTISAVAWRPSGDYALAVGESSVVYRYQTNSLSLLSEGAGSDYLFCVGWKSDGTEALLAGDVPGSSTGGTVGIVLSFDGSVFTNRNVNPTPGYTFVKFYDLCWQPGGTNCLLVAENPGMAYRYTGGNVENMGDPPDSDNDLYTVEWTPDGGYALMSGDASPLNSPDLEWSETGGFVRPSPRLPDRSPRELAWNPDGTTLLVGSTSGRVFKYTLASGSSLLRETGRTTDKILGIMWSPTGEYAILTGGEGGSGVVLIYDALRNEVLSDPVSVEPASVLHRGQWKPGGACAVVGGNRP